MDSALVGVMVSFLSISTIAWFYHGWGTTKTKFFEGPGMSSRTDEDSESCVSNCITTFRVNLFSYFYILMYFIVYFNVGTSTVGAEKPEKLANARGFWSIIFVIIYPFLCYAIYYKNGPKKSSSIFKSITSKNQTFCWAIYAAIGNQLVFGFFMLLCLFFAKYFPVI